MVGQVTVEKEEGSPLATQEQGSEVAQNGDAVKNGNTEEESSKKATEESKENTYTNLKVCFLCGKPATEVCDKCGLVAFCSEAHKKLHRPENFCFPFMVEQREGVGRYVVAVRDIEPLELVMWDSAAALGPRMGCAPCCLQCLKPADGSYFCQVC